MSRNEALERPRAAAGWGRWFRFGLRTLLVSVAFCAVLAAWWRDRSELQRRLDQSELLRRSMLPPSDERNQLERSLLAELGLSETARTVRVHLAHGGSVATQLEGPPGTPTREFTSETHTIGELQQILIDRSVSPPTG